MSDKIYIFDTTLRDGEQSPGASMNLEEKIQIAEVLEEMEVDIIEAGFPIASNGDFECVSEISKNIKNSTIAGLARAKLQDIDRAWEAVKNAKSPRIHTFIATSPVHMKYKLKKNKSEVLEAMEYDSEELLEKLRIASELAIEQGNLKINDAQRLIEHIETSLRQSTYLQE